LFLVPLARARIAPGTISGLPADQTHTHGLDERNIDLFAQEIEKHDVKGQ
jgi:hypothetical protein